MIKDLSQKTGIVNELLKKLLLNCNYCLSLSLTVYSFGFINFKASSFSAVQFGNQSLIHCFSQSRRLEFTSKSFSANSCFKSLVLRLMIDKSFVFVVENRKSNSLSFMLDNLIDLVDAMFIAQKKRSCCLWLAIISLSRN